jgi:hypothetical protein
MLALAADRCHAGPGLRQSSGLGAGITRSIAKAIEARAVAAIRGSTAASARPAQPAPAQPAPVPMGYPGSVQSYPGAFHAVPQPPVYAGGVARLLPGLPAVYAAGPVLGGGAAPVLEAVGEGPVGGAATAAELVQAIRAIVGEARTPFPPAPLMAISAAFADSATCADCRAVNWHLLMPSPPYTHPPRPALPRRDAPPPPPRLELRRAGFSRPPLTRVGRRAAAAVVARPRAGPLCGPPCPCAGGGRGARGHRRARRGRFSGPGPGGGGGGAARRVGAAAGGSGA